MATTQFSSSSSSCTKAPLRARSQQQAQLPPPCLQHEADAVNMKTADYYQTETQRSLRRTLQTLKATDEVATKACFKLDGQTEQIQRTQNAAEETGANLDQSEKLLKSMSSFFRKAKGVFSKERIKEKVRKLKALGIGNNNDGEEGGELEEKRDAKEQECLLDQEQHEKKDKKATLVDGFSSVGLVDVNTFTSIIGKKDYRRQHEHGGHQNKEKGGDSTCTTSVSFSSSISIIDPLPPSRICTFAQEQDDLKAVEGLVGNLREKSQAIGTTLSRHNEMLDKLNNTTDRNIKKLERNKTRMKQVLK
ncbi:unnamed protein product [Amoebophrya sp. A25]|nr:unnamed protein product [Amoebophrya sp. A25]|eukprot:GSA25T00007162001.1